MNMSMFGLFCINSVSLDTVGMLLQFKCNLRVGVYGHVTAFNPCNLNTKRIGVRWMHSLWPLDVLLSH